MIDIDKFRQLLGENKAIQRFKIEKHQDDIPQMLEESYKWMVTARGGLYSDGQIKPIIEKVAKWLTGDFKYGLLLYGTVGSGKSTMMDAIRKLISVLYARNSAKVTAIELCRMAKSKDSDRFEDIMKCGMLYIDDMGEEPTTIKNFGSEISPLVETIYHRYDKQLFTVITSNLLDEEIKSFYGDRVSDRFNEMFDKIYYNQKSFRI